MCVGGVGLSMLTPCVDVSPSLSFSLSLFACSLACHLLTPYDPPLPLPLPVSLNRSRTFSRGGTAGPGRAGGAGGDRRWCCSRDPPPSLTAWFPMPIEGARCLQQQEGRDSPTIGTRLVNRSIYHTCCRPFSDNRLVARVKKKMSRSTLAQTGRVRRPRKIATLPLLAPVIGGRSILD